jgi:hypothetical protein
MTRGIPKKCQRDEQLREKRAKAVSGLTIGALKPVSAVPIASRPPRLSEPLPAHTYPAKKIAQGKPQIAGVGKP